MKKRVVLFAVMIWICCGLGFRAAAASSIGIDYDCGDRTFFHSDYLSDIGDTYKNCSINSKDNTILLHRCLERYNPNRTDNSIYMEKFTDLDCHLDIYTDKQMPYILIRARAKSDALGAQIHLCYVRDSETAGRSIDESLLRLTPEGAVVSKDGVTLRQLHNGEWFRYAVAIDLMQHRADLYLGDDGDYPLQMVKSVTISSHIQTVNMVRFWLDYGGDGSLTLDELEVTGMRRPYTGAEDNYSSVFHSDQPIEAYLADKTAFHAYGGGIYSNGKKAFPEATLKYDEEQGELFADRRALQAAFGLELAQDGDVLKGEDIVFQAGRTQMLYQGRTVNLYIPPRLEGGSVLVPVKAFAVHALGKEVFDDKNGMVLISDTPIELDLENEIPEYQVYAGAEYPYTDIKSLNWYLCFQRPTAAQIQARFESRNTGHPRLTATREDFERIREGSQRQGSNMQIMCDYLIGQANNVLSQTPDEYNIPDKQRILDISRRMVERMEYLGFAYQLTGDQKYVDCAWAHLSKIAAYPDWNPSHMIDVGEMNYAFAIAYDWMYDGFTERQRSVIYEAARRQGLEVTRLAYYGRLVGWAQYANRSDAFVTWKSNFNTVINGGALSGAMAFFEEDPAFFADLAEKAVRSMEFSCIGFQPSGGWIEGPGYWDYTLSYLSKGVGSMLTALGTDYGLLHAKGISETALFCRSMIAPQGCNNFHDAGAGGMASSYFSWLGNVYDEPLFYAIRRAQLQQSPKYRVQDAIWHRPDWPSSEEGLPLDIITPGIESIGMRTAYDDPQGMYFSAHGGLVFCYHSHADAGSFIYDALGVRWADDLGSEDYNVQRDGIQGFYSSYRRRAEAHNVVVINPNTSYDDGGQVDDAFVPLTDYCETDWGTMVQYDMTAAYAPYVNAYQRQFFIESESQSLVVGDMMDLKEAAEVNWFMTTKADVTWTGEDTFILQRDGKTIYGRAEAFGGTLKGSTTDCSPLLGAPLLEGQNENVGYSRLRLQVQGDGRVEIRVTLSPDPTYQVGRAGQLQIAESRLSPQADGTVQAEVSGLWGSEESCFTAIIAQKNQDGALLKMDTVSLESEDIPKEGGLLPQRFTKNFVFAPAESAEDTQVQLFVIDSLGTLQPLAGSTRLTIAGLGSAE